MKYNYYIVHTCLLDGGRDVKGYSVVETDKKIKTFSDIERISESIKDSLKVKRVIIENWKRIKR